MAHYPEKQENKRLKASIKKKKNSSKIEDELKSCVKKKINSIKCSENCRQKCGQKISSYEKRKIGENFNSLSPFKKLAFYSTYIMEFRKKRTTVAGSHRLFSREYTLPVGVRRFQVCCKFFLETLNISHQRIQRFYVNHRKNFRTAMESKQGKHQKLFISTSNMFAIIRHINLFPAVESHYCRRSSTKLYLDPALNLRKMYTLYYATHKEALSFSSYRKVFKTKFNLSFLVPKKDQCGICYMKNADKLKDDGGGKNQFEIHRTNLHATRELKSSDKSNNIANTITICFDLANVFLLPKTELGQLFYCSKLTVFNLTAKILNTNKVYFAIWTENEGGHKGDDIASALWRILQEVIVA